MDEFDRDFVRSFCFCCLSSSTVFPIKSFDTESYLTLRIFSSRLHLARRFENHTCIRDSGRLIFVANFSLANISG